uniref:Uncharacterized protein n=1 Tax=Anguilla anguilla TaxID=7936 RepID=A0A0E9TCW4_ANGAN
MIVATGDYHVLTDILVILERWTICHRRYHHCATSLRLKCTEL